MTIVSEPHCGLCQRFTQPGALRKRWWTDLAPTTTIDNLIHAFAAHLQATESSGCSPKTLTVYEQRYKRFLTFLEAEGHAPPFGVELLNASLVRRSAIWTRENTRSSRGGNSAARYLIATLKTCSAWLADEGYLFDGVDPLSRVKRPKVEESARAPLTQDEVRALVVTAQDTGPSRSEQFCGQRDATIIRLLLDTGMRIGGALSIMREDLDLRERRVLLRLKGGRQHTLYFGSPDRRDGGSTARSMRAYVTERDDLVHRGAERDRGDCSQGRLFLSYDGWPLTVNGWHQALKRLADRAGLHGIHPHRFRHTMATHFLIRHPGDETGLRGILGHLSDDMFRVYTHIAHEIVAQRAGRVALSEAWLATDDDTRDEMESLGRRADHGHSARLSRAAPAAPQPGGINTAELLQAIQRDPELARALLRAARGAA